MPARLEDTCYVSILSMTQSSVYKCILQARREGVVLLLYTRKIKYTVLVFSHTLFLSVFLGLLRLLRHVILSSLGYSDYEVKIYTLNPSSSQIIFPPACKFRVMSSFFCSGVREGWSTGVAIVASLLFSPPQPCFSTRYAVSINY